MNKNPTVSVIIPTYNRAHPVAGRSEVCYAATKSMRYRMSNKKEGRFTVIFLPRASWNSGDYRRSEAMADTIARRKEVELVLYINPAASPIVPIYRLMRNNGEERFQRKFLRETFRLLTIMSPFPIRIHPKFFVLTPLRVIPKKFRLRNNNGRRKNALLNLRYHLINRWLNMNTEGTRIALADPFRQGVSSELDRLNCQYLAADIYDDPFDPPLASALFRSNKEHAERKKEYLSVLQKADIVFANSQHMIDQYLQQEERSAYLVPSGINLDQFLINQGAVPWDLKAIESPRVGYIGNLNYSLDIDLLLYLLTENTNVNFVLIGNPSGKNGTTLTQLLGKYRNLILLGHKPHGVIPRYLQHMDVLFSFKRPDITRGNDSLKIYEYLATGKPIVTTPVSPAESFKDSIYVARDMRQFNKYLKDALEENNVSLQEKRKKLAEMNTWEKRVDTILEKISQLL